MNKKIKTALLVALAGIIGTMGYLITTRVMDKKQVSEQIKKLPAFEFHSVADNTPVSNKDLKANTPVTFIFFSTQCDYCHYEVREIKKHIEKFRDYQIFMVCSDTQEQIADFVKVYDLDKYDQIKVLKDPESKFSNYFGASVVPSIYIYNRNSELVKNYRGEVKIEAILDAIES
jgi:peroxiredoxin